jgi:uncharacterized protein YndB with AHSA1/START domain
MAGAEGPCGYARLEVADRGGVRIHWELKIAFPGGTYEEERTMLLDAERRLVGASFSSAGRKHVGHRTKPGTWEVTSLGEGGKSETGTKELAEDSITGMGFVLAAWMPREAGVALLRADVNEAAGFERAGSVVIRGVGEEPVPGGDGAKAFRYDLTRKDGRTMPIHVNAHREILRVDWGGGTVMTLSRQSTRHLFQPIPPAVAEVPGGPEKLVVRGEFPRTDPATMFARWTKPAEIVRWWPPEAEIEPKVGGTYHLSWPAQNWFLKGRVTVYEEGKRLGFTWRWHHEPDTAPKREVLVEIAAREGGGSVLTVTHGPYTASEEDQAERKGHLAGWRQFCTKLKALEK